jgi:hypothetical protein
LGIAAHTGWYYSTKVCRRFSLGAAGIR